MQEQNNNNIYNKQNITLKKNINGNMEKISGIRIGDITTKQ